MWTSDTVHMHAEIVNGFGINDRGEQGYIFVDHEGRRVFLYLSDDVLKQLRSLLEWSD